MKRIDNNNNNNNYSTSISNGTTGNNMKNMKYRIYALHEERKRIKERRKVMTRILGFLWVCFILFVRRKLIKNRTDIASITSTTTTFLEHSTATTTQYNLHETNSTSNIHYNIPTLDTTTYNENMNDTATTRSTTTRAITITNHKERHANAIIKTSRRMIRQIRVSSKKIISFFIVHPVQQIWSKLRRKNDKKGRGKG